MKSFLHLLSSLQLQISAVLEFTFGCTPPAASPGWQEGSHTVSPPWMCVIRNESPWNTALAEVLISARYPSSNTALNKNITDSSLNSTAIWSVCWAKWQKRSKLFWSDCEYQAVKVGRYERVTSFSYFILPSMRQLHFHLWEVIVEAQQRILTEGNQTFQDERSWPSPALLPFLSEQWAALELCAPSPATPGTAGLSWEVFGTTSFMACLGCFTFTQNQD